MILLVSTPAPAQNFHHQFISRGNHAISHAVQMGYDYVQVRGAHNAGLKQMIYVAAAQTCLRIRDGAYFSKHGGMTAGAIARETIECDTSMTAQMPPFKRRFMNRYSRSMMFV